MPETFFVGLFLVSRIFCRRFFRRIAQIVSGDAAFTKGLVLAQRIADQIVGEDQTRIRNHVEGNAHDRFVAAFEDLAG